MTQVDFTTEEVELLNEMLDAALTDLRGEIADTDRLSYREMLKQREHLMKELIKKMQLLQPATKQV